MTRVLITGGGGKTGHAVARAVIARGVQARVFVRHVGSAPPDADAVVGDQRALDDVVSALDDADAVYAIAPNMSVHEIEMASAAIEAARRAGVERLVFHSVVHPQLSAMPHHHDKQRAEELVIESGLDWTILQPNAYVQNLAGYVDDLRAGRLQVPYRTDRASAFVDLRDVADVAASALVDGTWSHATLELSGPREVSMDDVAQLAAELLGHEIVAERLDPEAWLAANSHLPSTVAQRLHAMFVHYDTHGSPGDATVLGALLGREPRTVEDYLREVLA